MRRRDRAKDDPWIRAFLRRASWGYIATVEDGYPFLNSNLFVYEEKSDAIYLHSARVGQIASQAGNGGPVAFSAGVMGRLLPAEAALSFSVEYASVVVSGRLNLIDDDQEKQQALQLLLDKYAPHLEPGRDYNAITSEELKRTAVYRIEIYSWSGKQKAVPQDFPGAFNVPPLSIPLEDSSLVPGSEH